MTADDNYSVFRECLASAIVGRSEGKPKSEKRSKARRAARKDVTSTGLAVTHERADPEELAEFIDVSTGIYTRLMVS